MPRASAKLIHREDLRPDHYLLTLDCPEIARSAQPGQFVHLRVGDGTDPLLRRPLSIMLTNPGAGEVQILMRTVGRGTNIVASHDEGVQYDLLGPLGTGWTPPEGDAEVMLVAGGIGVAPLIFLADSQRMARPQPYLRAIFGGATEEALVCWTEYSSRCDEFVVVTEDGSAGETGLATEVLAQKLDRRPAAGVYACGPDGMLAAVARICADVGVPCQVSMEQWMGCGVGACLGCAIPASSGGYVRVCTEGPVFDATEIDWERLMNR
ncbi:MAG: dihydroorotate dehydrogenase electron transfer subunit [Armatimonadia bacterium]|nr:dihydroorotate dehydrogenase electron transfer subunit [Armatimonadia bacterium]